VLEVKKPDENFYLQCDLMWLSRAVRHLLEVAMEGSARAELSIGSLPEDGVAVTIAAWGLDIEATRARSMESVRHGMGIGVAFARCVVELHGGSLIASQKADGAAVFEILLPRGGVQDTGRLSSPEAA